jgi:signal transduction histidine kinase
MAIVATSVIVLPLTGQVSSEAEEIRLHMLLASIAAVGFLAGSFAEAESRSHAELARRNRMLYHADRLKTLRAMSVAVIHEISQPLSTIAIEAKNLAVQAHHEGVEQSEFQVTADLIARKARDLAQMVRRLRSFGDRAADDPSPIPISQLLADLSIIAAPEAKTANVRLELDGGPHACVIGQDIEIRQALLNLVRNAIAASPSGETVRISHVVNEGRVRFSVENALPAAATFRPGMGIGLIVARSITEANGGWIREERPAPLRVRFVVDLPLHGEIND